MAEMIQVRNLSVGDQVDLTRDKTEPTKDHVGDHAVCLSIFAAGPVTVVHIEPTSRGLIQVFFEEGPSVDFRASEKVRVLRPSSSAESPD